MLCYKFISNSKEVISAIACEDYASTLKNLDLHSDRVPIERALGIYWCVESDTFQMRITLQGTPNSKARYELNEFYLLLSQTNIQMEHLKYWVLN